MPTYEYRCTSCGEQTEAVQAFTDAPLTVCPACGETALRKLFGNVGVVFKGSGFYRTDSRAESNGNGKTDGKGDSKNDGKPASDKPAAASGSDAAAKGGDSKSKPESKPTAAKPAAAAV